MTLLLAALALTMTSAHVLELPQKMEYGPDLYSAVNTTMYRYFAIVGGAYTMGAIAAAAVPSVWQALRGRWEYGHVTGFVLQLLGFSLLLVSVLVETPGGQLRSKK